MANEQNLVKGDDRHKFTLEEQMKGNQRSIEVRQEQSRMRKLLRQCLNTKDSDGIPYEQLVTFGLIKGAIGGNAKNYETIVTMLGEAPNMITNAEEKPMPKIELEVIDNSDLEKTLYENR